MIVLVFTCSLKSTPPSGPFAFQVSERDLPHLLACNKLTSIPAFLAILASPGSYLSIPALRHRCFSSARTFACDTYHHRQGNVQLPQVLCQPVAVHIRHIDIGQHDINAMVIYYVKQIDTIIGGDYLITQRTDLVV